jgi:hypothetical protein
MGRKRKSPEALKGPELLHVWRKETCKLTLQQAANVLDLDVAAICAFETGHKSPGAERAARIEEKTGGAVPVSAWPNPRPRGRQRAA